MLKIDRHISLTKDYDGQKVWELPNITHLLSEDDLARIGQRVWEGFVQDKRSRAKWEKRTQAAMDLAMQIQKGKSFPWPGCANVMFPLVTIACLQFHSRAYPALVQAPDLVKMRTVGPDIDGSASARAQRVAQHMSWQLLEESTSWEEQHDRLLINVPIVGCAFKKTYNDPSQGGNQSDLVLAQDLVMDYYAKSVEACGRKTQIMTVYRNEIYTGVVEGRYRDVLEEKWYASPAQPLQVEPGTAKRDNRVGQTPPYEQDDFAPYSFLEQHCWMDLDGDGYCEPWIVTIESNSRCPVRITARWDDEKQIKRSLRGRLAKIIPTEYYTKYPFIPSPDGGVYDVGFGVLLGPLNSSANSIVNQLLDAGTLQTTAGGFLARGAKIRGGQYQFSPFGWNRIDATGDDIRKSMVQIPVNQPSDVLFKLLGLIIEYTGRIAGTTETMVGENPGQNTPAGTTQTMVEQGQKIYAAIFKRMWRSEKEEFKKLYSLNAVYLPDTEFFGQEGGKVLRQDYLGDPNQVLPVADPNVVSDSQQLQRAIAIKQAAASTPGYALDKVERKFLRALRVDDIESIYPGPDKTPPLPNPKAAVEQIKGQARLAEIQAKGEFELKKVVITLEEQRALNQAKITQLEAQAAKLIADAKGVDMGHEIAAFNAAIGALKENDAALRDRIKMVLSALESDRDATKQNALGNGMGRMGTPSSNASIQSPNAGANGGNQGAMG